MSHTRYSELPQEDNGNKDMELPFFYIDDLEKVIANMKDKDITAFQPCRVAFHDKDNEGGIIEGWALVGLKSTTPMSYTRVLHQDAQLVLGCGYFNYNNAQLVIGEDAKASSEPTNIPLVDDVEFEQDKDQV